jgi:SAM-dependent methyltransferase
MANPTELSRRTISDFGDQWTSYKENEGYYASTELFSDIAAGLLSPADLNNAKVGDIGSGSGRIVLMLLNSGAGFVHAVEPSAAFDVLKRNTTAQADRIFYHHVSGEMLPAGLDLDLVVSIGVLHHIPEPDPVLKAAYAALRPGGKCLIWLYGREGNELYLALVEPLRWLTVRLPHGMLVGVSHVLNALLGVYAAAAAKLPLPLAGYMRNVIGKLDRHARFLVIYDQLNPAYAKYYREDEARALMQRAGFTDVKMRHRHGYSWTVIGTKAPTASGT